MKRILQLGLCLLVLFPSGLRAQEPPRVVRILQDLIRADTTNPPGNESRGVAVVERYLATADALQLERLESAPGRANLIARLPGTGEQPPLILLSHIDVVTANPQEWSVPPFEARIQNDYVWGRGAIDMKGMLAMQIETLLQLATRPQRLQGDVILIVAADEEAGGTWGLEWLIKQRPELLKAGWVLNEGSIGVQRADFDIFPIQVAEKGVCWLKVSASGRSGHGSMPDRNNAVLKLAQAMERIGNYRFPLTATAVSREFLAAIAEQMSFPESFVLRNLFTPVLGALLRPLASSQLEQDRTINAILRHTAAPTQLTAGQKVNVIPAQAVGTIDARTLPGTSPEAFRDFLQGLVGDEIELAIMTSSEPNESPRDTPVYKMLVETIQKYYPEAVVAPFLSAGATDSRFFRAHGIPAYGLIPVLITEADLDGLHGKNERIPIQGLKTGVDMLKDVIEGVL